MAEKGNTNNLIVSTKLQINYKRSSNEVAIKQFCKNLSSLLEIKGISKFSHSFTSFCVQGTYTDTSVRAIF